MCVSTAVGFGSSSSAPCGTSQIITWAPFVPVTTNGACGAKAAQVVGASVQMYCRNSAARPRWLATGLRHSCSRLSEAPAVSTVRPSGPNRAKLEKFTEPLLLWITPSRFQSSPSDSTSSCLPWSISTCVPLGLTPS